MADDQRFRPVDADRTGLRTPTPAASCPTDRPRPDTEAARRLSALLAGIAAGDRDAFLQFYRSTHDRVFGLSLRLLRRPAIAEEITQEIYLYVWNTADEYDTRLASPIGWLMMLTHRRAVDRIRAESSAATRELAYGHRQLGRDHDIVAETVSQRSEERAVVDCLATLTDLQRETVALAYYGGRTYAEVAEHLGIPLNTVKSRIRDGLKRLQNCLAGSVTDA
ncbi:ECF RNA polymerase sigma factor SigK [Nocardia sp. NPDC051570]|uniref:ECF RNA polymerase sigma factor SigK n=1 Tax=Nocardia sp. NPDC051570 TaxID=3364324 RepID=UPI0037A37011